MKNRFSRWPPGSHLGFTIGTILAIFDLQAIPLLPATFQVNWLFNSEEEATNWGLLAFGFRRSEKWTSNCYDFSYF